MRGKARKQIYSSLPALAGAEPDLVISAQRRPMASLKARTLKSRNAGILFCENHNNSTNCTWIIWLGESENYKTSCLILIWHVSIIKICQKSFQLPECCYYCCWDWGCLSTKRVSKLSLVESNARKSINSRFICDLREEYVFLLDSELKLSFHLELKLLIILF